MTRIPRCETNRGRGSRREYRSPLGAWRSPPTDWLQISWDSHFGVDGPERHVVCYYLRGRALLNFVGQVPRAKRSPRSRGPPSSWERLKQISQVGTRTFKRSSMNEQRSCFSLVALLPAADRDVEHSLGDVGWRCGSRDIASSRSGRLHGDRKRRRPNAALCQSTQANGGPKNAGTES